MLVTREGAITRISLNRPRALNALNREMFELIAAAVTTAETDGSSAIVLDSTSDRGFSGGGDIKEIAGTGGRNVLTIEYALDYALATASIPVIGFMDGITMGGGIGLTGHASHRIVTERSRLAMPEARIGIVPDIGGHLLLANAPGRLGEYLAVTSHEMTGADALALGFADHLVPAADLSALREALAAGEDPDHACARFASEPAEAPLISLVPWWEPLAERALGYAGSPATLDRPAEAALALASELAREAASGAAHSEAAAAALAAVRGVCPTSVAVTLAQLARTRRESLGLAEVLEDDLRVLGRLTVHPNFAEGVRAQVIDKDRNPRWQPARLEDLDPEAIAAVLDMTLAADEPPLGLVAR